MYKLDEMDVASIVVENYMAGLFFTLPCTVESFSLNPPRVQVKPLLNFKQVVNGETKWIEPISLPDIPIIIPRGGGYCLTIPIKAGDRGLLITLDRNIHKFLRTGELSNTGSDNIYEATRRHNLADSVYLPSFVLQSDQLVDYDTESVVLRSDDNTAMVQIDALKNVFISTQQTAAIQAAKDVIIFASDNVQVIAAGDCSVSALGKCEVSGSTVDISSNTTIDGKLFLAHTHSGVMSGGAVTGPPV